jgi:uncharacterized protein involved in outer membrane biogenesis
LAIVVSLILASAIVFLAFADFSKFKPQLEAAVTDATGREFRIAGTLEPKVFPVISLVAEDITLANADWSTEPLLAEVGHLTVRIGLWQLLSGAIVIRELRLRDVAVLAETGPEGQSNLDFDNGEIEEPNEPVVEDAGESLDLRIELAEIRNARFISRSPGAKDLTVTLESMDLATDEARMLNLNGTGQLNDHKMALQGSVGPLEALSSGDPAKVDIDASLGNIKLAIEGTVGDLEAMEGNVEILATSDDVEPIVKAFELPLNLAGVMQIEAKLSGADNRADFELDTRVGDMEVRTSGNLDGDQLTFASEVPSLDRVGAALDVEGLPARPLSAAGQVRFAGDHIVLNDITVKLDGTKLLLNGKAATADDGDSELDIRLTGTSLAELREDLPDLPFELVASTVLSQEYVRLDPMQATVGDSNLSGSLTAELTDARVLTGRFESKLIDLTPFAGDPEEDGETAAGTATTEAVDETAEADESEDTAEVEFVFTEEPLDFEALRTSNLDIELNAEKLKSGTLELEDIEFSAMLNDGKLQLTNRYVVPDGGEAHSSVNLDASGETAELQLRVDMQNLRANIMSGEVTDSSMIPPIGLTLNLESKGNSARDLAAATNGRVQLTQGPGRIESKAMGAISGDVLAQLFGALNPFSKEDKYSNWECTVFGLEFEDGLGEITGLLAQGEKIQIVGGGKIDLNTEKISIKFNTKPRKGVGISADMFVTPFVRVAGTLASPSVGLNKTGATVTTGAAIATAGLSLVAQGAMDRVTAEVDRCEKVLEKTSAE